MKIADLLSGTGGTALMPRATVSEIWEKAWDSAAIPQVASSVPAIIGENSIPFVEERPRAQVLGEGEGTKGSTAKFGSKTFTVKTVRVGVPVTYESLESDPAGVVTRLKALLGQALADQIDLAVIHGKQALDGTALTGVESLADTVTNSVDVSTASEAGAAIWAGHGLVTGAGYGFGPIVADPRLISPLASLRDSQGRRLHPEIGLGDRMTSFDGASVLTTPTVSGSNLLTEPTALRGVGGDWSALKLAQGSTMTLQSVPYGDPLQLGRDMASHREVALIMDTRLGWALMDPAAFVKYELAAAGDGEG